MVAAEVGTPVAHVLQVGGTDQGEERVLAVGDLVRLRVAEQLLGVEAAAVCELHTFSRGASVSGELEGDIADLETRLGSDHLRPARVLDRALAAGIRLSIVVEVDGTDERPRGLEQAEHAEETRAHSLMLVNRLPALDTLLGPLQRALVGSAAGAEGEERSR